MAQNGLSPKKTAAIEALLTARTIEAAAEQAGVSRRTLTRWLADEEFRAELHRAQDAALDRAVSLLAGSAAAAAGVLSDIAEDRAVKPAARVSAARSLLTQMLRAGEQATLAERLARLEEMVNASQSKRPD